MRPTVNLYFKTFKKLLLLSNLFQNALISECLNVEGQDWSHFLRLFKGFPFQIVFIIVYCQGASQHSTLVAADKTTVIGWPQSAGP
jgi:hypothetical protein